MSCSRASRSVAWVVTLSIFMMALAVAEQPESADPILPLPEGVWITYYESGPFTIQPGAFYNRGLVTLGCPVEGSPCTITVGEEQVTTYDGNGGVPFVAVTWSTEFISDHPWERDYYWDIPREWIGELPISAIHEGVTVRHGAVQDGASSDRLAAYLLDESNDNPEPGKVDRFGDTPPIVRVVQGATADMIADTAMIVREINEHLPSTWQLQFSNASAQSIDEHVEGEIRVAFIPKEEWQWPGAQGRARTRKGFAGHDSSVHPIIGARVWVKGSYWTTYVAGVNMRRLGRLFLAHEMLHALGRHHPDINGEFFNETVMGNPLLATQDNPHDSFLASLDKDALLAVYSRFSPTDNATDAVEILGTDWMASLHLWGHVGLRSLTDVIQRHGGGIEYLDFGASSSSGVGHPWAYSSMLPWNYLTENAALSGFVSWDGRLLGLTSGGKVVTGRASISIDLTELTGFLEFSSLESWEANQSPGKRGSGVMWGEGCLHYAVDLDGNVFVSTDDDAETVSGSLFGAQHEAFGGVIELDGLIAGFGGLRDGMCFVDDAQASVTPCD